MSYTYSAGTTTPTYAGLVEFGGIRINDGSFKSEHLAGLEDGAPVRQSVASFANDWGGYPGAAFLDPREIEISGWLLQALPDDVPGAKDALRTAFALGDGSLSTLTVNQRGWATARQCSARPSGPIVFTEPDVTQKKLPVRDFTVPLVAPDPRLYNVTATTTTITTGTSVTNNGNASTPFVVRFTGAATNPSLTTSGGTVAMTYSVTSGHYAEVTTTPGGISALTDLGVNVYGDVTTFSVYTIPPGTSTWTYTGGGTCTITFRDAWT